ncbi:hypothetical protein HYV43_07390 [Candidatus Micrarchaeota archaeon]|nr:hypothetical protein [Candidatus Micrarchaeota archaeon]
MTTGSARGAFPSAPVFFIFFLLVASSALASAIHYSVANQTTCACEFATLKIHAENLQGTLAHEDLTLASELDVQPGFIDVQLQPAQTKIYPVYVHAACDASPGVYPVRLEPAGIEASVRVKDCSGFSLTVTPEQSSCQNEHVLYAVTVQNDADTPRNVSLGTDLNPDAYVMPSSITLLPREKKSVLLSVNTNTLPQRLPFRVVARAEDQVVQQPAVIDVNACTGFRVEGPSDWSLASGQSASIAVTFQNLGVARPVRVQAFCPSFIQANATRLTVASGQVAAVILAAQSAPAGHFSCTVVATTEDDGRTFSHTVRIDVLPSAANYSVTPSSIALEEDVVQRFTFTIRNTGRLESASVLFESNATRVVSGPSTLSAASEQNMTFSLTTDCSAYPFELTRGGARHVCPFAVQGQLHVNNQSFPIQIRIVPPTLLFDSKVYSDGSGLPGGVRVDVVATNLGNATDLLLSSQPRARGPARVFAPAGGQAFFSVFVDNVNATQLIIEAQSERGTYRHRAELTQPVATAGPISGLVTLATPVIAFSAAVLLALALLYFLYRRAA